MAKQRNAVRAGFFMIVAAALIVFVVVAVGGSSRFTQSFTTYPIAFSLSDDISGLAVGDDVRLGGLRVGDIRDIKVHTHPDGIVVFIAVPSQYPLAADAVVSVQKGLTGAAAINIDSLGNGPQATQPLRGHPDALAALVRKFGEMEPDLQQVVANVKSASGRLDTDLAKASDDLDKFGDTSDSFTETGFTATQTLREVQLRMPDIFDRYDRVTDSAVAMLDSVNSFVGPSSTDFHGTLSNLNSITANLRREVPDVTDRLKDILAKFDTTMDRAASAMRDVQSTAANARDLTASVRSILVDNKSKIDDAISSAKSASDNLKYATEEIRHSPWRLLYQPKPDEMANLNTYDSVRQFAEGADSLNAAAAALRDAVKDRTADPKQIQILLDRLNDSFAKFQAVQAKLWKDIQP